MIRIRSHVDGFRRAGMAHPDKWREYPDGTFSEEQLKALKAEPALQVEFTGGTVKAPVPVAGDQGGEIVLPKYEDITEAQIADRLDDMQVDRSGAKNKKDHYALLEQALKAKE